MLRRRSPRRPSRRRRSNRLRHRRRRPPSPRRRPRIRKRRPRIRRRRRGPLKRTRSPDAVLEQEAAAAGRECGLDQCEALGRAYLAFSRELPHYFDACARFQAHQTETGEIEANEVACVEAGHRVHEVLAGTLERGIADGSIRRDLGNPYVTSLALWSFTHGMILIAASKGAQIEHEGIRVEAMIEHALALALRSIAA